MKQTKTILAVMALLTILMLQPAMAASTKDEVLALQTEVKQLREGQEAMRKDLAEIKKLLESGARPEVKTQVATARQFEPRDISIAGAPFMGDSGAQVVLVEYNDYQCRYCKKHLVNTMPALKENFINTGKLKFVMREFPLTSIHPKAVAASLAALCASDQGKYWEMHDTLFEHQKQLDDAQIKSYGESIGLDIDTFVSCMDQGKYNDQVKQDLAQGREMGISGTPSFALGVISANNPDQITVMQILKGAKAYETFEREINALLNEDGKGADAP